MIPEFAYLLKVNVAFVLFYFFYRLFFSKDTFFRMRRCILLAFFGIALVYPLFNIQGWIQEKERITEVVYAYAAMVLPEVEIAVENVTVKDWTRLIQQIFLYVYVVGGVWLFLRFLLRLCSVLWLACKSEKVYIGEEKVCLLNQPIGPFSFFRLIFLHLGSHTKDEIDEILAHEGAHVSQWHSVDVIVSELISIMCWLNPFVWLLRREVRYNLEYLADNRVLQSGYDSRGYQYHLLGLSNCRHYGADLYNNFNILHLKNRIKMMNKKRSSDIGRAKYLLFVPLVAILLLLNNIDALARMTKLRVASPGSVQSIEEMIFSIPDLPQDSVRQVFTVVDEMPQFPGGEHELMRFIGRSVKYPVIAQENGIQGRVVCTFVVTETGDVIDATIIRSVDPSLDMEALRVVNSFPKWIPGKQGGRDVAVKYTMPILFNLSVENSKESDSIPTEDQIFTMVENMPRFPEGEQALMDFIKDGLKYPADAKDAGVQGRVVCTMVISREGEVKDIEVVRSLHSSLDKEAVRVLGTLPKWEPGIQRGVAVNVKYTIPVIFKLDSNE